MIDLPSWTENIVDLDIDQMVSGLTFSPEGKALYWTVPTRRDPAHGIPHDHELHRYDLNSGDLSVVVQFPSSFIPSEMHLLGSGRNLAVYGLPTSVLNLSEMAPQVFVVDVVTGRITADIRLDDVKAGQIKIETAEVEGPCCHLYSPGLAWDLEKELLYIVHADEDVITVIDLAKGELLQRTDISPRMSLLKRLKNWLVPLVEAKLVPGTLRRVVLSADGTRLYVLGLRQEMTRESNGEWGQREIPLGLQVIATDDLSLIHRLDLPASNLALSPDGERLLLVGSLEAFSESAGLQYEDNGLYFFDTKTFEDVGHLQPDVAFSLLGFSPDSRYAYVSQPADPGHKYWTKVLQVLDLESQRFVTELENTFARLIPVTASRR
ncbi:MAG: hypothetical protein V3U79_06585 [Dehalococcoidia bacterium]